ncbi:MAG: hypothetical protein HYS27_23905 [Deltaproteobacteria bacterium]|nr:hypothetical protein [Deltaproteobacteria bacterium]
MGELASLGLVVVALALAECAWWVRHGAVVLRVPLYFWGGALTTLSSSLGNERGAFALLNPLPPFGRAYVLEPWPCSLGVDGVVSARTFAFGREQRPLDRTQSFRWDEVETLGRDDATLLLNGAPFASCSSRHHAEAALRALQALKDAKPKDRERTLDEVIAAHVDPDELLERTARHRSLGSAPLIAGFGLFLALFGAIPFEVSQRGLEQWPRLVLLLFAWVALTALSTWMAHRGLYGPRGDTLGATRGERWGQLVLMFLAPYTALRANDRLGRNLLAGLHPIAAALALAKPDRGHHAVLCALRDLQTPRPMALDAAGAAIEADFRARLLHAARKRAEGRGVDVAALARTPELRAGQVAWCPRCLVRYRQAGGACADCGVALSSTT